MFMTYLSLRRTKSIFAQYLLIITNISINHRTSDLYKHFLCLIVFFTTSILFQWLYGKYNDIFAINKHIDNKNKLTRHIVNRDCLRLYVKLIHYNINI